MRAVIPRLQPDLGQAADAAPRLVLFSGPPGVGKSTLVCYCDDPDLWRRRIETRPEMVPGWTPADWVEARRVAESYEAWTSPHLLLDAVDPFDCNLDWLLRYVLA
jgi:hypothetical protein